MHITPINVQDYYALGYTYPEIQAAAKAAKLPPNKLPTRSKSVSKLAAFQAALDQQLFSKYTLKSYLAGYAQIVSGPRAGWQPNKLENALRPPPHPVPCNTSHAPLLYLSMPTPKMAFQMDTSTFNSSQWTISVSYNITNGTSADCGTISGFGEHAKCCQACRGHSMR
jgi:hypothetical protein